MMLPISLRPEGINIGHSTSRLWLSTVTHSWPLVTSCYSGEVLAIRRLIGIVRLSCRFHQLLLRKTNDSLDLSQQEDCRYLCNLLASILALYSNIRYVQSTVFIRLQRFEFLANYITPSHPIPSMTGLPGSLIALALSPPMINGFQYSLPRRTGIIKVTIWTFQRAKRFTRDVFL